VRSSTDEEFSSVIQQVVANLKENESEIGARMFAQVRTIPHYVEITDEDLLAEVQIAVQIVFEMILRLLLEAREITDEEISTLVVVGFRSAERGIPVESILATVMVSEEVGLEAISSWILEHRPGPQGIRLQHAIQVRIARLVDSVREHLRDGADRYRKRGGRLRDDPWTELLRKVLMGRYMTPEDSLSGARIGRDLNVDFALALVTEATQPDRPESLGSPVATLLARFPAATVVQMPADATGPGHDVVMIPALLDDVAARVNRVGADVARDFAAVIVVTGAVRGPGGIHETYEIARLALGLAAEAGSPYFSTLDNLLLRLAAAGRGDFRERLMAPLMDPLSELPPNQRESFLRILRGLWEWGGVNTRAQVAARLHMHPNTLTRNLEKLERITDLAYDVPADQLRINLALVLSGSVQFSRPPQSARGR
jgi:hypothetical protein